MNNTYDSLIDLGLGAVPQIDDPELYQELLDIHNAIETLLTRSDTNDEGVQAQLTILRAVTYVDLDYNITTANQLILVDSSANDVVVALPTLAEADGATYTVKVTANNLPYTTTVVSQDDAPIDGHTDGIGLDLNDALSVKGFTANNTWSII